MKDELQHAIATLENIRDYKVESDIDAIHAAIHFKAITSLTLSIIEIITQEKRDAKNKMWMRYSQDFDLMTDDEINKHTEHCIEDKHDAECWLDAVQSWEAAGRPRNGSEANDY
jgi:hypothetical protein